MVGRRSRWGSSPCSPWCGCRDRSVRGGWSGAATPYGLPDVGPGARGTTPAGTPDVADGPVVRAWRRRAARDPAHVPSAPPSAVAPRWGLPAAVLLAVEQEAFGRRPPDPEAVRAAVEALDGTGPSGTPAPDLPPPTADGAGPGAAVGPPP